MEVAVLVNDIKYKRSPEPRAARDPRGMSRSLLNFGERRCRVERYAALEAGATGFTAKRS